MLKHNRTLENCMTWWSADCGGKHFYATWAANHSHGEKWGIFSSKVGKRPLASSINVPVRLRESDTEKPCQIPILGKLSVALTRLRNVFWPQLHPGCPFLSCRNVFVVGTSRNPIQRFFYSNSSPRNEIVMTFFLLWNRRYLNVFPIHWK